jgi:hypothetical protein
MSESERASIEAAISELKRDIYALVGRWALAIILSVAVVSATAMHHWNSAISRIGLLERSVAVSDAGDSEDVKWQVRVEARLARIEALLEKDR